MGSEKGTKERYYEMFYVNDNGHVRYERGYECPPNDGYWWFPSLGFSTSGVYKNKDQCISDALKHVDSEIEKLQKKKKILEASREG